MNIAYLRISTEKQHLENQKSSITKFASDNHIAINKWHMETVSGIRPKDDRSLGGVLKKLKQGDVIIVSEISRLSRKMLEIMTILNTCIENGITLYSIKEGICFKDDMNSKIMGFAFGIAAEIERNLISARTKEALAYKRSQGIILGRPNGSTSQQNHLSQYSCDIEQLIISRTPISKIALRYNVSRGTLYSFLKNKNIRLNSQKLY